jgi:biopolymer transport protein ExbB
MRLLLLVEQGAAGTSDTGAFAAFKENPWFLLLNLVCSAIVLTIIIERFAFQLGRYRVNSKEFFAQIKKLVAAGNIDRAIKLCEAADVPLLRVFRAGLMQVNRGDEAVVTAIEEQIMDIEPSINKRIGALWSLANIGTLFGLLGTIMGLIRTFGALDKVQDPGLRQQRLAHGIAEAMYNTALGLGIALMCMVAHLIISGQAKKIIADLESTSAKLTNLLTTQRTQG